MAVQLQEARYRAVIQQEYACNVKGTYKEINVINVNLAHQIFKSAIPLDVVDVRLPLYSAFDNKLLDIFLHLYINTLLLRIA